MTGIPQHVIDEIRQRADIVEVVSEYLPLKKSGTNWRALCPFHEEKTPSFNVNPARQIFHCFGCGEGGNALTFVMKMENVAFPEAVRLLGRRYGVDVPDRRGEGGRSSELDRLYEAVEAATKFYGKLLRGREEASPIDRYIKKRRVTREMIETFRLGWSPDSWDGLLNHLRSEGFDDKTLEKAGLVKLSSKGNYIDRFRARLMFPITGAGGRVVGFGGRIIGAGHENTAKYINSPETPIYSKSRVLYGFSQARQAARDEGVMIVVEGYMDVLALHGAGAPNCVALSGTAFTARQAELIKRVCDRVVLLLDSDQAGVAAARRSVPVLLDHEISVRVLSLPGAKDPDEFLGDHGAGEFKNLIRSAPTFAEFMIEVALSGADLSDIEGKTRAVREVIPFLRRIRDRIERSHYVQLLAEKTGTDVNVISREVERGGPGRQAVGVGGAGRKGERKESAVFKAERILIRILLEHPEYLDGVAADLAVEDFSDPVHRKIFALLSEASRDGAGLVADMVSRVEDEELRKSVTELTLEKAMFDKEETEKVARDCVSRLRYRPERRREILDAVKKSLSDEAETARLEKAQKKYFEFRKKEI